MDVPLDHNTLLSESKETGERVATEHDRNKTNNLFQC